MKKSMKALLIALCAVLLVAGSIFGTLAYLTSTAAVTNTFTVGKVAITLDEAKVDLYGNPLNSSNEVVTLANAERVYANEYKLIPGHEYTKDPTVTVKADSEECYVFVKVINGLGSDATLTISSDWTALSGVDNVYCYKEKVATSSSDTELTPVFTEFTLGNTVDVSAYAINTDGKVVESSSSTDLKKISVDAYAVQADGFSSAAAAWTAANFS